MEITAVLALLKQANQLKRTARTGWVQRGVPNAEDVAAHSYGVVFATLLLAELIDEPLDLGKALALAALHDLPEAHTTDIPSPAWRHLPAGVKPSVERGVMAGMVSGVSFGARWMALWEEMNAEKTAESRLIHDADKLDMYLQAFMYEQQTGNRQLAEFWENPRQFQFPAAQALYDAIYAERMAAG